MDFSKIDSNDLRRDLFEDSYYDFMKYFWDVVEPHGFEDAPYIEYLCDEVQKVFQWVVDWEDQENAYDLVINVAPGTSKSSIVSKFGPAYLWTMNPDASIIATSYSSEAVKGFTDKFNKLLRSDEFLALYPDLILEEDNVKTQKNKKKGVRFATSTGASITSKHADVILCDDADKPPKVIRDANGVPKLTMGATVTEIMNGNAWHDDTLLTRKTSKVFSRSLYVQQRVHQYDLSGYLLKKASQGGMDVKHINLPSEISKAYPAFSRIYRGGKVVKEIDLSHLYTDDLLDPNRMSKETLTKQKKAMGTYTYNSQFLQKPSLDSGGIIKPKLFEMVDANGIPDNLIKFFYSDTSEGNPTSDNMATVCWSLWEGHVYIWEIQAVVKPFNEFIGYYDKGGKWNDKVYDLFVKRHGQTKESKHIFEAKSSGTPYIQYINAQTPYNAIPDKPTGSKLDRVRVSLPRVEAGRVKLVKGAWIEEFLEECRNFSGGDGGQDDRVDVLTGLIKVTSFNGSQFLPEKEVVVEEDKQKSAPDYARLFS